MKLFKFLLIVILATTTFESELSAYDLDKYFHNYPNRIAFFGRHPHARKESMGRTSIASKGHLYGTHTNPANLTGLKGISLNFSLDPENEGLVNNNDWLSYYLGGGIKYKEFGFGAEYYYQRYEDGKSYDESGNYIANLSDENKMFNFSMSYDLLKNLTTGITLKFYEKTIYADDSSTSLDFGLLYNTEILSNNYYSWNLDLGTSLTNITNSEITKDYDYKLPIVFRFGGSNKLSIENDILTDLEVNLEFYKILNTHSERDEEFGFQSGSEISLYNYIKLRAGYYYELYEPGEDDYLSNFTYGFGFHLPMSAISVPLPMDLYFDYNQLESEFEESDDEYFNYSFTLNYNL